MSCAGQRTTISNDTAARQKEKSVEASEYNSEAIRHYMDGVVAELQGNYAMAALDYQEALQIDSSATTIYSDLGNVYLTLGKYPQAEMTLRRGLKLARNPDRLIPLLAEVYLLNNKFADADTLYYGIADTAKSQQDKVDALTRRAEIALQQKNYLKVAQLYEQIYLVDHHRAEMLEKARVIYLRLGRVSDALRVTNQLVANEPQNPEYKNQLAEFYSETGQPDSAMAVLKPLVQQDSLSDAAVMLGELYYKTEKLDSAKTLLTKVIANDTTNVQVLYYLGLIALEQQHFVEAQDFYQRLLHERDDVLGGYTGLGFSFMGQDKYDQAIRVIRNGLEKFPDEFALVQQLGESFFYKADYDSAKVYLEKAVQLDSTHLRPKRFLAFVYDNLGNRDAAEKMYLDLLDAYPNEPLFLNNLGYLYAVEGRNLQKALSMVKEAVKAQPENASYLDTMGWVYYKIGDYEKALEFVERALHLDSENAEVLEHLGDIYTKLGQPDRAQAQYQKALEIEPGNQEIQDKVR